MTQALSSMSIILRTAMVFGNEPGGVYTTLRWLVKFGLGGSMGHGRQWVSWLHAEDFCRSIEWLIANDQAHGVYNLTSPEPLTNAAMMRAMSGTSGPFRPRG